MSWFPLPSRIAAGGTSTAFISCSPPHTIEHEDGFLKDFEGSASWSPTRASYMGQRAEDPLQLERFPDSPSHHSLEQCITSRGDESTFLPRAPSSASKTMPSLAALSCILAQRPASVTPERPGEHSGTGVRAHVSQGHRPIPKRESVDHTPLHTPLPAVRVVPAQDRTRYAASWDPAMASETQQ